MTTVVKGDFIDFRFTGKVNGEIFDSNIEEDARKISPDMKPVPLIIVVGEHMVVRGLDNALEGKEIGKTYTITVRAKDGFGQRNTSLIKTLPLTIFAERNITPQPGMTLALDNHIVKIRAVSGARVIADFNNPLAGKDLDYIFIISRKVEDISEKARSFFEGFLHISPKFNIGEKVTVRGPKELETFIMILKDRFKALVGKDLDFSIEEKDISGISQTHQTQ